MSGLQRIAWLFTIGIALIFPSSAYAQNGPDDWERMHNKGLGRELAGYIKSGNASQKNALSNYMVTRFENAARDDKLNHSWVVFADEVKDHFTGAEKAAWVQRIQASLPVEDADLRTYPVQDLYASVEMQSKFGNTGASSLWVDWWNMRPPWQGGNLADLCAVAHGLSSAGPEVEDGLRSVADFAIAQHLQDADKVQAVAMNDVGRLGRAIRGVVPAKTLIEARKAFEASAVDGITHRSPGQVGTLIVARHEVYGVQDSRTLWADWVSADKSVRTLSPNLWGYTMKILADRGPSTAEVRNQMVEDILGELEKSATSFDKLMSRVARANWGEIGSSMPGPLPEDRRRTVLATINAVVAAQVLEGIPGDKVTSAEELLRFLGEEDVTLMLAWANTDDSWKRYHLKRFRTLAIHFSRMGDAGAAHRRALADIILQERITDPTMVKQGSVSDWRWMTILLDKEFSIEQRAQIASAVETHVMAGLNSPTLRDAVDMGQLWQWAGNEEKHRSRSLQAYNIVVGSDEARAQITAENLSQAAVVLLEARLVDSATEYPALAQAVVAAHEAGTLDTLTRFNLKLLGQSLSAPNSRQIVMTAAVNETGLIDPELAHVMTHAYRVTGALDQWVDVVEQKIVENDADGDAHAHWLIAQAIAQAEVPRRRSPIRGFASLEQALRVAASDSVKVVVAQNLVDYFDETRSWDAGVQYLDSIEDQFSADAAISALDALKTRLEAASIDAARKRR